LKSQQRCYLGAEENTRQQGDINLPALPTCNLTVSEASAKLVCHSHVEDASQKKAKNSKQETTEWNKVTEIGVRNASLSSGPPNAHPTIGILSLY
jgi:hypothetical protein